MFMDMNMLERIIILKLIQKAQKGDECKCRQAENVTKTREGIKPLEKGESVGDQHILEHRTSREAAADI